LYLGIRLLLACALPCLAAAVPARAHHQRTSLAVPADGISIPTISHGQMVVLADNRAAILEMAERQMPTDRVMRRLQGFINIQFSVCLWGLMPGGLTDEDSPFNECTHAHLAATKALLLYLQGMPGDRAPVRALVEKVELEMLINQGSLVLCRYSDQSFNTSEVICPDWNLLPYHVPSLVMFVTVLMTTVGSVSMVVRWKPGSRGASTAGQNAGGS
jgi:hypothetical protein